MRPKVNLNAYFERIGFAGSIAPTVGTLDQLVQLHPATIPFENLDALVGETVLLDQASLERKLLAEARGGHGFEHNLLLLGILGELDYTARAVPAAVTWPAPQSPAGPDQHLVLLIEIGGQTYLVDVGFGAMTPTAPLKLRADVEQATPHGNYRLLSEEGEWRLEAQQVEEWLPLYSFNPKAEGNFEAANHYVSGDPASPLRRGLVAALSPKDSRIALVGNALSVQPREGDNEQRQLTSLAEMRDVLSTSFGISLPQAELLDPKLEAILAGANVLAT